MQVLNQHEFYALKFANDFRKQIFKGKIYLTQDYKVSFKPDKYLLFNGESFVLNDIKALVEKEIKNSYQSYNDAFLYSSIKIKLLTILNESLPEDYPFTSQVDNLISTNILVKYKLPIIKIDNVDLIRMIENTDLNFEYSNADIKLPFDSFLLKFKLNDLLVELFINRIVIKENGAFSNNIIIYADGIGLSPDGEILNLPVPLAGFGNLPKDDPHWLDNPMLYEVSNFLRKLLYYFTIDKTIEYVNKTVISNTSKKTKSIKEQKYNVSVISLFKDIRYNYDESLESGTTKIPHLVRGHFRKQPFGSRDNPEYKIIWIEPYFTGNAVLADNKKYVLRP